MFSIDINMISRGIGGVGRELCTMSVRHIEKLTNFILCLLMPFKVFGDIRMYKCLDDSFLLSLLYLAHL